MTDPETPPQDPAGRPSTEETPGPTPGDPAPAPRPGLSRRAWTLIVSGALALLLLLICGGLALAAATVREAVSENRQERAVAAAERDDLEAGCLRLEERLNRLTPPGATTGPAARAKAIRDETAAARPFLLDLERLRAREHHDDDHDPGLPWSDGWRQLIDARSAYADALDRAAGGGDPAFYLEPLDENATPVAGRLIAESPDGCAGPLRRLINPSL